MSCKIPYFTILVICLLSFALNPAYAQSEQDTVALNFLKFLGSDKEIGSIEALMANRFAPEGEKISIGTLVNLKDGGYILISGSRNLTPIKAYSLERPFFDLPEPYRKFLLRELEYNVRAINAMKVPEAEWATENQKRWNFLLNREIIRYPNAYNPGTPLLSSRWNQDHPYNRYLPEVDGKRVVAGCVNIAVGQILRYYKYPIMGTGVASYMWNNEQLKAILYRNFNWENMPDVLDTTTPEYMVDEVAKLIKDLAVVNHTNLGIESSGATINLSGLIEHFGLSNTIAKMDNNDFPSFLSKIKEEINGERPLLIEFPGHLAIADGYGSDHTGDKIHVNMGWGGFGNDYYYLDQTINYDPNNTGKSFSETLRVYYNVKPCSGDDCAYNLEQGDTISGYTIIGRFNFPYDGDSHKVYLKGETTIGGSRTNISSQAFYISVYDAEMRLIKEDETSFTINLPPGLYTVRSSLCDSSGTCWDYTGNAGDNYTVNIATQPLTVEEKATIDAGLDRGPVILNELKNMILNSNRTEPLKILIDARDENGDDVNLSITNTNENAISVTLLKNILHITPVSSVTRVASKLTVIASANGKRVEKSFIVMALNEDVSYGKSFSVSGLFDSQTDFDTYRVILDGTCSIVGSISGYTGQPFFISVRGKDGLMIIQPKDASINYTFTRDIYILGASLKENPDGSGHYYNYDLLQNHNYTLTVTCKDASEDLITIAAMLGVDLSGTITKPLFALMAGWNFVSFPKVPAVSNDISTMLKDVSNHVKVVWGFDNSTKAWQVFKFNIKGSKFEVIDAIESGKGYWIYMDASGNIDMEGWIEGPQTITLYGGWNLVGYNGPDGGMALPPGYTIIWGWDNGLWSAKLSDPDANLNITPLTVLKKTKAYWIKMKENALWNQ